MALLGKPKIRSVTRSADDTYPYLFVKCIADADAAGNQVDQATVTVAADVVTFQIAPVGGGLANDAGIDYTGQAGADGTITITDANANTPQEFVDIVNGRGVGQTAFRRWRASVGFFRPDSAITGGDFLARAATNALLGRHEPGLPLFGDSSAQVGTERYSLGLGIDDLSGEGGGGVEWPDYFEDIPGSSTTAGVNTPLRTRRKREDTGVIAQKVIRLISFSSGMSGATTTDFEVWQLDGGYRNTERIAVFSFGTAAPGLVALDEMAPIEGRPGSPLWLVANLTGAITTGTFSAQWEEYFA